MHFYKRIFRVLPPIKFIFISLLNPVIKNGVSLGIIILQIGIGILMAEIAPQAIWATSLNLKPHFQTLYVEYVVAFPREPFNSLMLLEVLQANVASAESHVSVSFQENNCGNFSKVLVVILPDLL
jgi:hypothetical protein